MLIINGVADHVHILLGYRPHQSLSDLVQDIKGSSSKWINERKFTRLKFAWQEGYGAFSYSHSHLLKVINYIRALLKTIFKINGTQINTDKTDFHRFFLMFLEVPIKKQEQHHKKITFMDEYKSFLKAYDVAFDEPR